MARCRYIQKKQSQAPSIPFFDAEEAWFWFMRSQRARLEGAKMRSGEADVLQASGCDHAHVEHKQRLFMTMDPATSQMS